MPTAVEFLEEMARKVSFGEVTSFAVVAVNREGELSLDKTIKPEDKEMVIEGLQHLAFIMDDNEPPLES